MKEKTISSFSLKKNCGSILSIKYIKNYLLIYCENSHYFVYNSQNLDCLLEVDTLLFQESTFVINEHLLKIKKQKDELVVCLDSFDYSIKTLSPVFSIEERLVKELSNGFTLVCELNNKFKVLSPNGKTIVSGCHNNWILDACIINDKIYTISIDGCVKVWKTSTNECVGYLPIKKGWLTAITCNSNTIYIGTQYSEVYIVDCKFIVDKSKNKGAIWGIAKYENTIFSISEDGIVSSTDFETKEEKYLKCSEGWINAINFHNNDIIVVSSKGEIISVPISMSHCSLISKFNLWLNNFEIIDDYMYLVSAEGFILKFNLNNKEVESKSISQFQLIDIISYKGLLVAGDVEGNLYFFDQNLNLLKLLEFPGLHFSSLTVNKEGEIFASSLEGIVLKLNNELESKLVKINSGRIWKVSYNYENNFIMLITTNCEIIVIDSNLNYVQFKKKLDFFVTTCYTCGNLMFCGSDKGDTVIFKIPRIFPITPLIEISQNDKYEKDGFDYLNKKVIVFYNKNDISNIYRERDKLILKINNIVFVEKDISDNINLKNLIIRKSGWSKFPQILFYGHFISSASVLPQMSETGTLCRCINNIKEGIKNG